MDWKDLLHSPDSTDSFGAVSSHNHQDKKGKALEMPLPLGMGESGEDLGNCFQLTPSHLQGTSPTSQEIRSFSGKKLKLKKACNPIPHAQLNVT